MTVGIQIGLIRRKKGMKQKELSRLSGVKQSLLSMIESDKRNTTVKTLSKIANALDHELIIYP